MSADVVPAASLMTISTNNFLALTGRDADYERARFAVLVVPYEATTCYVPGTRNAPAAILSASQQLEDFDDELQREFHKAGIATLRPVESNMAGPEAMHHDLFRAARRVVRDGKFPLSLGGEHSITAALVRATMTRCKNLSVLQIDAHCDLRDHYQGTPYSHASVMRRVFDLGATIVPVGVRNVSREEHRFIKKNAIEVVTARECHEDHGWMDRVIGALGDTVYVTIDIDGFDPAFAPGTGTPEPGGLDWYQVTGLLRKVAATRTIVGADIVEVIPIAGQAVTEFLAARLAHKLIGYVQYA